MWRRTAITLLVPSTVLVAAYLHARGLSSSLSGALGPALASSPPSRPVEHRRPTRAGDVILERNPFDSSWRPAQARPSPTGPLEAPRCPSMDVAVVSESSDESWSLASLSETETSQPRLVRRGDRIGDRAVLRIGDNPLLSSPTVWLGSERGLCQVVLRERGRSTARAQDGPAPAAPADPRIRRLAESEREIDRSLVTELLARQGDWSRWVRVDPSPSGRPRLRLVRVTPGSLPADLGLANGDTLIGVDGRELSTPEQGLAALIALRSARELTIDLERGGKRHALRFRIR